VSAEQPPESTSRFARRREEPLPPTGTTEEEEVESARMANRFDIRRLIGGLFVLYGLILIAVGIFGSHAVKTKAAGMLVFGCLMIFWALARPVAPEPSQTRGEGSGRIRRAPAT
jgi:hypothetical protein